MEEIKSKIPKSFKLFATTIDVEFNNDRLNDLDCTGLSEMYKSKITLSTVRKDYKLNSDYIVDTFYHEKIHIILDSMERGDLSADEKFVDVFAKLLRQSDETEKY